MLVLTPPGDEEATPSFLLSGTVRGMELAVALGDSCDTLGTFADAAQAVAHARQLMRVIVADTRMIA